VSQQGFVNRLTRGRIDDPPEAHAPRLVKRQIGLCVEDYRSDFEGARATQTNDADAAATGRRRDGGDGVVSEHWFLVPGSWFLISGLAMATRNQELETRNQKLTSRGRSSLCGCRRCPGFRCARWCRRPALGGRCAAHPDSWGRR